MLKNETLLELDYSVSKKVRRLLFLSTLFFSLLLSITVFTSYQNPSRLDVNNVKLNDLIKIQISSIEDLNNADTSQNINDQVNELLVKFYKNRNYNTAWIQSYNTNKQFNDYLNLLDSAKYYGFPFDYFSCEKIKNLKSDLDIGDRKNHLNTLINLELTTTYSSLKYLIYLNQGIIEKDTTSIFRAYINSLPNYLNEIITTDQISKGISAVQPDLIEHDKLIRSLSYFIDLNLSIKYTSPAFINDKLLAKSLYYSGISSTIEFDSTNTKSSALFNLQEQFHLSKDSLLNDSTHNILVEQLQKRYYQACLNLHRLRKLNHTSKNYLFVNIPEFKLHVIESNQIKDVFNVIVGKKKTPTPTLTSTIEKVIANPYWTVPRSILTNEMVHKIRKDSTYLTRNGYYVIDNYEETVNDSVINWNQNDPLGKKYWLRQINSRNNALGQVKFIFPNDFSVYLHDTPSKRLFRNTNRTYSHGCIRLENPDKLAQYLSDHYYKDKELNIKSLISKRKRQEIKLSEKINIHIQYITCSGNENNDMVFYNDIYNLDKDEIKAVFPNQPEKLESI
ncbi:MAG: L,D-transpeptidase family protein [Bacteroidales bacterium]|nr:L,D-transpeptidase family protein [Bacteroidales bacterium]